MRAKPLAIDLFCGLGGWTEGLLDEGYDVIGYDVERHVYGEHRYPAQLVLQDVLTLDGSQFRDAALIVASPPCQAYSYMSMPWSKAKAKAAAIRADATGAELEKLNRLFNACFRIQREACAAAGRHIPLVVENVRGAEPWVGKARWSFGSFYLWGDVPALMPPIAARSKLKGGDVGWRERGPGRQLQDHFGRKVAGFRFDGSGRSFQSASVEGVKQGGAGHAWFDKALDERRKNPDGRKQPGINLSEIGFNVANAHAFGAMVEGVKIKRSAEDVRQHIGTKRKFASAMIAKIPLPLSRHIARTYFPVSVAREVA